MKKLTIVLFALLIISQSLFSQSGWFDIYKDTTELYDIKFINSLTGFTCGERGKILKTTNGGENWVQISFNNVNNLMSIAALTDNIWYIASHEEKFFKTTNAGTSWDTTYYPGQSGITKMSFLNANTGYAYVNFIIY